ncbi:MAG: two pore domain potassium channel family protein [Alphaproteobacteria bacterium]|nr:two pore domain potassium channel family protein [Alphaproteobacteria bacterium]
MPARRLRALADSRLRYTLFVGAVAVLAFALPAVPEPLSALRSLAYLSTLGFGLLASHPRGQALRVGEWGVLLTLATGEGLRHAGQLSTGALSALLGAQALVALWLTGRVALDLSRVERATTDALLGGVAGYLLLGAAGAFATAAIARAAPEAFAGLPPDLDVSEMLYYSFVTLTSLGFGDITPVSRPARAVTTAIAVAGQLYLAVFVGIIVGKYITGGAEE